MKSFYQLLGNSLVANITNFFLWSSIIYWSYLETNSVVATSVISGIYLVLVMACGFWFGSIVDHHRKKAAMLGSSIVTLAFYGIALAFYAAAPAGAFNTLYSFHLWAVIVSSLLGVIAGNIRGIALPTAVTLLVPEDRRDKANGLSGTIFGLSFAVSNVGAGLGLGFFGMFWVIVASIVLTLVSITHLLLIKIPEEKIVHIVPESADATLHAKKRIDIKGTFKIVKSIPGLLPLIFFTTFNNFLGGIFMSLMDAYGLSLVSVQVWGTLWGFLSFGFIIGGLYIAKKGLGKNPVRTIFNVNLLTWTVCIFMTAQPSITLLAVSIFIYLVASPFIEASEQTVIQKVVPAERQGRVFGFAQSIEQAASPITAFMIGPITQTFFIPFMTTGAGVGLIGNWYGIGEGRGIGLVFTVFGIIGLIVTAFARSSKASDALAKKYQEAPAVNPAEAAKADLATAK